MIREMFGVRLDGQPDTPYKLQVLARHQMIEKLYHDILMDLQICEIEGWDKTEYIRMLQKLLNDFRLPSYKTPGHRNRAVGTNCGEERIK